MRRYGNLEVGREASRYVLWPWMLMVVWYDRRALDVLRRNLRFNAPSSQTLSREHKMWAQHFQLGKWLKGWAERCQ